MGREYWAEAYGTNRHGAGVRVTVSEQLVQCHSEGPDIRGNVEFTLDQTFRSIPERHGMPNAICLGRILNLTRN